ncbi:MAG: DUF4136 domain-containing protein [Curvibacter sp.]|nr:DUF4136 domain-containing protein [Curvibacter sp.]
MAAATTALLLGGCASSHWQVESDVETFASTPVIDPGSRFRFERLPSQQQAEPAAEQDRIEALAQAALERVGLQRDDANAQLSILVGARSVTVVDPTAPYPFGHWPGYGWSGRAWAGRGMYYGSGTRGFWGGLPYAPPRTVREVAVLIRDTANGKPIYETHAASDGLTRSEPITLGAMFDAALQGFPTPPTGLRRVNIDVQMPP